MSFTVWHDSWDEDDFTSYYSFDACLLVTSSPYTANTPVDEDDLYAVEAAVQRAIPTLAYARNHDRRRRRVKSVIENSFMFYNTIMEESFPSDFTLSESEKFNRILIDDDDDYTIPRKVNQICRAPAPHRESKYYDKENDVPNVRRRAPDHYNIAIWVPSLADIQAAGPSNVRELRPRERSLTPWQSPASASPVSSSSPSYVSALSTPGWRERADVAAMAYAIEGNGNGTFDSYYSTQQSPDVEEFTIRHVREQGVDSGYESW